MPIDEHQFVKDLAELVRIGVEAERERCARIAEDFCEQGRDGYQIAKAIRRLEQGT